MANTKHLEILKSGTDTWNQWRKENPEIVPDLRKANLKEAATIQLRPEAESNPRIATTTVARLLGEAIRRIHNEESVSSLFV